MEKDFRMDFKNFLRTRWTGLAQKEWSIPENLVTHHKLNLPPSVLDQARDIVGAFFKLRQDGFFQKSALAQSDEICKFDPGNYSLFMSYDFHLTESGLKLIEINTNAAGYFLTEALNEFQQTETNLKFSEGSGDTLKTDFENELQQSLNKKIPHNLLIVDENPTQQFAYTEFLLAKHRIRSWGWPCEIKNIHDVDFSKVDFIYNRWTDFLLQKSEALRVAWLKKELCLSPNPHEYALLSDKARLIQIHEPGFLESTSLSQQERDILKHAVPQSVQLTKENAEELFAKRKGLFFKPQRSFGSKAAYRGDKISRPMFEKLLDGEFIVQEFAPPPETEVAMPDGSNQKFKYDIRVYAYKGAVRMIGSRLFQGQLLNMRAPGSGFAAVRIL